jgi:hypothetical protein
MTVNKVESASEFIFKRFVEALSYFLGMYDYYLLGVNFFGICSKIGTSWHDAIFSLNYVFYRILRVFTEIKGVDGTLLVLIARVTVLF